MLNAFALAPSYLFGGAHSLTSWRLCALSGLIYAYYHLYERFRFLSKQLLHWLGDRVIEVA